MATKTVRLDDLDGTEGAHPIRFALADRTWEIDLSAANTERLERALDPFVKVARPVRRPSDNGESAAIREWAAQNDIEVNLKGRISSDIVQQYRAAQTA